MLEIGDEIRVDNVKAEKEVLSIQDNTPYKIQEILDVICRVLNEDLEELYRPYYSECLSGDGVNTIIVIGIVPFSVEVDNISVWPLKDISRKFLFKESILVNSKYLERGWRESIVDSLYRRIVKKFLRGGLVAMLHTYKSK